MRRAFAVVLFLVVLFAATPKEAASGQAWAVIDAETGRLLQGHNENARLPIASLTKIWTAFTIVESGASGDITISPEAASAEGSSIYTVQGAKMPSEALLHGLMLRSGNDAAYALAEHAGGSLEGFVDMMNEKALYFGLKDTKFMNPSGLHHEEHLSTAYDTAKMLYFAMQNDEFKKIASSKSYIYKGKDGDVRSWSNKHRLIHTNPDVVAGKTGFTKVAGRTLATYFERDGKKIIIVTLNDGDDWKDHTDLANQTFKDYDLVTVAKKGKYSILPGVEGQLDEPIKVLLSPDEKERITHFVRIPRGKEKISTGSWTVSFDNQPIITTDITIHQ
ncbi:D-alanyl-D-alanine carboxypeptidase family protein [Sporosarcina cyprini]|uniref:D-alanyl-D-alanine carboxypeptidase family protein n=1 Tax=Sporosarcina cyprini TaxID=2910523 RepID=UPI001EDE18EE|nr:D-alanyl-D-alanine carboxypeptidase family protein [Sporosarcina cyprini]MCG3089980.1 D-alanyl-D-alanine carboxypeptidase [Sporosarcina cyprini]